MNAIARRSALAPESLSFSLPPGHDIVEIKGDIMMPTYYPGTLAIVDRSTKRIVGEGLYFVHDGVGEACRVISGCSTRGHWAVSQSNKNYTSYEETADRIDVTGRVVGVFQRLA